MSTQGELPRSDARRILNYLMGRAKTDMSFRRTLLADPRSALESELKMELPEDFNIRFVENAGADLTVILPDPEFPEGELSDEDLEEIAGGTTGGVLDDVLRTLVETILGDST